MKKSLKIITLLLMLFTFTFVGVANVDALTMSSIKLKTQRKGYKDGKSYYDVNVRITYDGDYAYCMNHDDNAPALNKTIKCETPHQEGPILYILNNTSIAGTATKGKNEGPVVIRQKALWRYLNHIGAHSGKEKDNKYSKITGKEAAKAQKLYEEALKHKTYSINPRLTTTKSVTLKRSGTNFVGTVNVTMKDVKDNSYTVSLPKALSAAKIKNKKATSFDIEIPATAVTKKLTNQTVTVTGKKSPHRYVKQCHYDNNKQDMGVLVKATDVTPKDTTVVGVTPPTCTIVGTVYYGKSGTAVSQTKYYEECNPKCKVENGKYYDDKGKPVTEAEYYKACNPKCSVKNGKYYDPNGRPVTEAEYYAACNPKCEIKDGKYYNDKGKPVSETEFYQVCNPKCVIDNGKYYDPNGRPVTEDEYYKVCNPACEYKNGKYYDANHREVTEAEYYVSCNPKCEIKDGKYYNNDGKPVTEAEYYDACNPKCEVKDGKYYDDKGKPVTREQYLDICFEPTPNPEPVKSVDTRVIRYEKDYHYTIKHEVPYRSTANHYKSYVFTDVLEEPLQIKSTEDVKITQLDKENNQTTDWTDKFSIKISGQTITATLKDPSDAKFYGTRKDDGTEFIKEYSYILTVSLKDNAETRFDMTKYLTDEGYVIPDVANISMIKADGTKEDQPTNKVEVIYTLTPTPIKSVDKFDQTESYVRGTDYLYTITRYVPKYDGSQKYSSFVFTDVFEAPIQMNSPQQLLIKNELGTDVTSWFKVTLEGQKLTATLKDENNKDEFYGHTYYFNAVVHLRPGYNLANYNAGNKKYIIPNYATFTVDEKIEKTDIVKVFVAIQEKIIPAPNTASTASILGIAGGILLILGAAYALAVKSGIDPLGIYLRESKEIIQAEKATKKATTTKTSTKKE